jgi:hypothetical protein
MTIKVDPNTRVENAAPYSPAQIETWSGYVNALFESHQDFGLPFEAGDDANPGAALQLQQMVFMARMMATCQHLQAENEQLRGQIGEVPDADKNPRSA